MLGFIKNWIGNRGKAEAPPAKPAPPPAAAKPAPAPAAPPVPQTTPVPIPSGGFRSKPKLERVLLPLKAITDRFPASLQSAVVMQPTPGMAVALSIETVLEQIGGGKVCLSFGELRRISPAKVFTTDPAHDTEKVEIPLEELAARLDSSLLPGNFKLPEKTSAPVPTAASAAPPAPIAPPPAAISPTPAAPAPRQEAPAAPSPSTPKPAPSAEAKKSGRLAAPAEWTSLFGGRKEETAPPPPPPAPAEIPPLRPAAAAPPPKPETPSPSGGERVIKLAVRQPAAPPRQPVIDAPGLVPTSLPQKVPQAPPGAVVALPLEEVNRAWPETIREELQGAAAGARIDFPLAVLAEAIQTGKVQLPWKQLRQWIVPALPKPADPLYEGALVELPLSVVAPRFMAASGPMLRRGGERAAINEAIPTPFARAAAKAPAGTGAATAAPSKAPPAPAAEPTPEERMGALGLDGRLPADLVERACALAGVAGAVITLKEGLVVASKVPPEMKPASLGAFLPQLFSRVEQAASSMEIGPLQTLQFTAGDRPWQIWKAGAVLFAAVGRPNELLPGAQLKVIAAQLARQAKG